MARICSNCEFVNQDDYDYCAKCGNPLVEGLPHNNVYVFRAQELQVNKKAIIASYIITILLSWSGFIVGILFKNRVMAAFTFFGFFMPFYLIQSKHPTIRKHGLIMMFISLIGVALSFYVMVR